MPAAEQVVSYITEVVLADENSGAAKESLASDDAKKGNNKASSKGGKKGSTAVVPAPALVRVSAQEAAESLIDLALSEGSMDNITAVIVKYL